MSYPYFADVERAAADLKAEGKIAPRGANQAAIEADKGLITQRAAYYTSQRDGTIGVLEKTEGNHYTAADGNGYSVDWVVRSTDGTGWDVVTDNGNEAIPVNGGPYPPDPANIARWRPASAQNAQYTGTQPNPEPEPPPAVDLQPILDAIAASEQRLLAAVAADGQQTRDLIIHYADQVDQVATVILAAWLYLHAPTEPAADLVARVKQALLAIRDSDDQP